MWEEKPLWNQFWSCPLPHFSTTLTNPSLNTTTQQRHKLAAAGGVCFLRRFPPRGPQPVVVAQLRSVCCLSPLIILTAPSIYSLFWMCMHCTPRQLTADVCFHFHSGLRWISAEPSLLSMPMTETIMLWQGEGYEDTMTGPTPLLGTVLSCVQRLPLKAELWSHEHHHVICLSLCF